MIFAKSRALAERRLFALIVSPTVSRMYGFILGGNERKEGLRDTKEKNSTSRGEEKRVNQFRNIVPSINISLEEEKEKFRSDYSGMYEKKNKSREKVQ